VIPEFEKDLDDVFGILKEDVDIEKLRKSGAGRTVDTDAIIDVLRGR
jgi:hypothetical protein